MPIKGDDNYLLMFKCNYKAEMIKIHLLKGGL